MTEHGDIIKTTSSPHYRAEGVLDMRNHYSEVYETLRERENSLVRKIRGTWNRLWIATGAFVLQFPILGIIIMVGGEPNWLNAVALGMGGASVGLSAHLGRTSRRSLRSMIESNRLALAEPAILLRVWERALEMKDWDEQLAALEAENWRELKLYGEHKVLNEKPSPRVNIRGESYASMDKAFGGQAGPKTLAALNELKASGGWSPQIDENSEAREIARKLIAGLDELLTSAQVEETMDVIEKLGDLDVVPDYEVLSALRRGGHRLRKLQKTEEEVVDLTDWQGDLDPRRLWAEDNERERRERLEENRRASGWTQLQIDLQAADEASRRAFEASGLADSIHPPRRRGDRRPPFDSSVPHYEDCAWCAHDPHQANHSHEGGL
jgi:hypothetical protein